MRHPTSATWNEVLRDVNQHLMTIVEGSFGILADALLSVRSLIRGMAVLLDALTRRAERAENRELAARVAFDSTGKPVLYVHLRTAKPLGRSLEGGLEDEESGDARS